MSGPLRSPRKPPSSTAAHAGGDSTTAADIVGSDLWSSILDSVSSSRSVSTKNCIILGRPKSGKSTLVSRLASRTGEAAAVTSARQDGYATGDVLDLGLSYDVLDVGDETDDETVARLGVYQLPSADPPYSTLLPLALSKATFLDSLILITLDWERPWRFMKDLESWFGLLEDLLRAQGVSDAVEGQEGRQRLESDLRHYSEPTAGPSTSTAAPIADADSTLPAGMLSRNLGIPIVIVCTKADQINTLERDKDLKEEHFDYIQQALRTIALKFGAALFFTSHTRPDSFARLRAYILHRLFSSSATAASATASSSLAPASTSSGTNARAFPFALRANAVDRDQILIPAGWDSWGKIRILRDRFDAEALSLGWDEDAETESRRRRRQRAEGSAEEQGETEAADDRASRGALQQYEDMVLDLDHDERPVQPNSSKVEVLDDQIFLKAHYETLQKDREKDPRAAFAARPGGGGSVPASNTSALHGVDSEYRSSSSSYGAPVVGPVGNGGGLGLPGAERGDNDVATRLAKMVRKDSTQGSAHTAGGRSPALSPPLGSTSTGSSPNPGSGSSPNPAGGAAGAGLGGGSSSGGQNEVLANFFQSLLAARGTGANAGSAAAAAGSAGSRPAAAASTRAAGTNLGGASTGTRNGGGEDGA